MTLCIATLFTGVHGNYLKPSIINAGMDPANLPEGDLSTMNFGAGRSKPKAMEGRLGLRSRHWRYQRSALSRGAD